MSTVKISQLALIPQLNANTSNTLFLAVDIPTGVTGKFTGHTLAQGLYSHEVLNVGNNAVTLPNTVAQFALSGGSYVQTNLVNTDDGGTADIVVTANTGTDSTYFLDAGFANKNFQPGLEFNNLGTAIYPLDGYLYAAGQEGHLGGNLVIGSTTTGSDIKFIAGGHDASNVVFRATSDGLKLINGRPIYFDDTTYQNTAAAPFAYSNSIFLQSNSSFVKANSAYSSQNASGTYANSAYTQANTATTNASTADDKAVTAGVYANSAFVKTNVAFNLANTSLQNTNNIIIPGNVTISSVLYAGNTTINNGVSINDGGVYQYTTANNVTLTQLSNKNITVTANGRTGQITTSSSSLAKGSAVSFTVNNNQIVSAKDVVIVNIASGASASSYSICVDNVSVGSFSICITNNGTGALAESLVINFAILRVN